VRHDASIWGSAGQGGVPAGDSARAGGRGRRILLLLDPGLAGQLLAGHAADTVKGHGVQLTRAMLGDGLLTSEGARHDHARKLVAPAFSPRRLDRYVATFAECAQAHMAGWRDGQQADVHAEMAQLTLQIVGRTLLGVDLSAQASRVRAGLESALAEFARQQRALPMLARRRRDAHGRGAQDPHARAQASVHRLIDEISEQRRATPDRGDVMSALLAVSAEPGGLTAADVHDHVITFGRARSSGPLASTGLPCARPPACR